MPIANNARRAANEEELFTLLYRELDLLFKVCVARTSIFLALDGPGRCHLPILVGPLEKVTLGTFSASAAKLITQRKRRLAAVAKQQRAAQSQNEEEVDQPQHIPVESDTTKEQQNSNKKKKRRRRGQFNLLHVGGPVLSSLF